MRLVNLTPHTLNIHAQGINEIEPCVINLAPSGTVARVSVMREWAPPILLAGDMEVPVSTTRMGEVVDLPAPRRGVALIVSGMVLDSLVGRPDVYAPGELVRDTSGRPIGCKGLRCTKVDAIPPECVTCGGTAPHNTCPNTGGEVSQGWG
jgi:hypothetical protein